MYSFQLNDLRSSLEDMTSYIDYCFPHPNVRAEMVLSINVLTRSQWPSYDVVDIKIPKEMVRTTLFLLKFDISTATIQVS